MSDDFSWAPFGTPDDEAPPPLPPLPPHPDDEEKAVAPAPSTPPPEDVAQQFEPDPLPFEESEPPPMQAAPASDLGWSAPTPAPSTPPPTYVTPPTTGSTIPNLGGLDAGDFGAIAQNASNVVSREIREQLDAPGSKEAGQAFLWGILGVTVCPFLVPSIMAVVYGNRAKAASRGLGGQNHPRGTWGLALGWIGIAFWILIAVLAVVGAFSTT